MDSPLSTKATSRIQACFLDRDGVLNKKMPEGQYVTQWSEFEVLPGVVEAIRHLNEAGILVIVVSNQRGIAKGLYTASDVEDVHNRLQSLLTSKGAHIDRFYFCPHDKVGCDCRKPRPGMFEQARLDFPTLHAKTSVMIGDSLSDIEFGHLLGMLTIWIEGDKTHPRPGDEKASGLADLRFNSLSQAVAALLSPRQYA